ncbi:hypothetical protein CMV_025862 [Castanea mollissima]|uniref:TIR domain-containing protein n=1 Tax=Castanea mollissima TaxID=60419 RepID=A0A8J4QDG7_9ROSI|nr:hypothetical protein CMV_025862 [Castanea mollissima]
MPNSRVNRGSSGARLNLQNRDPTVKKIPMVFLTNEGASSSSSTCRKKYDVFLSFRGSKWCLDELVKIVECWENNQMVLLRPIFYNVEPSEVRNPLGNFGIALANHEKEFKEKMQRWREALSKAANVSGSHYQEGRTKYKSEWLENRSRIWCHEDANKLLTRNKGSDKIRGIMWLPNLFGQGCHNKYLRSIKLEGCQSITRVPDLCAPNLETLDISCCDELIEIHDSIGLLDKLEFWSLGYCKKLQTLPRTLKLNKRFELRSCPRLERFPDVHPGTKCNITVTDCNIREWPSSLRYLTKGIIRLKIKQCVNLGKFLDSTNKLQLLEEIDTPILDCFYIIGAYSENPDFLSYNGILIDLDFWLENNFFPALRYIHIEHSIIVSIPECIFRLSTLQGIYIDNCEKLREIQNPRLPQSIREVKITNCPSLLPQSSSRLLNEFGKILGILPNRVSEGTEESCEELWLFSKSLGRWNKPNLSEQNQVEVEVECRLVEDIVDSRFVLGNHTDFIKWWGVNVECICCPQKSDITYLPLPSDRNGCGSSSVLNDTELSPFQPVFPTSYGSVMDCGAFNNEGDLGNSMEPTNTGFEPGLTNGFDFGFAQPNLELGSGVSSGFHLGSSSMAHACVNDDSDFKYGSTTEESEDILIRLQSLCFPDFHLLQRQVSPLLLNNCKELREIQNPRLPQSIREVKITKCPSLLPQSSSRLLNEFGKILGILPNRVSEESGGGGGECRLVEVDSRFVLGNHTDFIKWWGVNVECICCPQKSDITYLPLPSDRNGCGSSSVLNDTELSPFQPVFPTSYGSVMDCGAFNNEGDLGNSMEPTNTGFEPGLANGFDFGLAQPNLELGSGVSSGFHLGSSSMAHANVMGSSSMAHDCVNDDSDINMGPPPKKARTS